MRTELKDELKDIWPGVMANYGECEKFVNGKHIPCPFCGGKDRFRFVDYGSGMVICNQCLPKGIDGIEYLKLKTGLEFSALATELRTMLGNVTEFRKT